MGTDSNGEEYEFLGTSISYSEHQLINLEKEHDELVKMDVEQLISDGYFDEEWTDYYAETDGEEEEVDENKNINNESMPVAPLLKEEKCASSSSQSNVPLFTRQPKQLDVRIQFAPFQPIQFRSSQSFPFRDIQFLVIQIHG